MVIICVEKHWGVPLRPDATGAATGFPRALGPFRVAPGVRVCLRLGIPPTCQF